MKIPQALGYKAAAIKAVVITGLVGAFGFSANAATLSWSSTAPTPGANDIYNFTGTTNHNGNMTPAGDDSGTYIANNRGQQGQTFTTGSNPNGYVLSAVTLQQVTYSTFWSVDPGWGAGNPFTVRIGTNNAGTFTAFATETAPMVTSGNSALDTGGAHSGNGTGWFFTLTLASPQLLSPNTTYAFTVDSANPYVEVNGTNNSGVYAGGTAFSATHNANPATVTAYTGNRVFLVRLTPYVPPTAFTWNGGGGNDNWATGLNWVGGTAPATNGNSLIFAGSIRLTPNMETNYSISGLVFSNNASSFTIGTANGNTLTLAGSVSNNSANLQTLNVPISLSGAQTIAAASGSLTLNSNITDATGLTLTGNNNISLNGNIAGGGNFAKNGAGTLTVAGNILSAGEVDLNSGTNVFLGTATNSGNCFLANGSGFQGTLNDTGAVMNVGQYLVIGGSGGTGTFNLANTSVGGTGVSGFGESSGSLVAGKLWVGGAPPSSGGATGVVNINTTGSIVANSGATTPITIGLGYSSTSSGTANLDNGIIQCNGEFHVGINGSGTFNQLGGTVNSTSWFFVGELATGSYNLTNGTVNADTAGGTWPDVGVRSTGVGTLNVAGGTFNAAGGSQLWVGDAGNGTLNVSGSGLVIISNATDGLKLGASSGGVGTVNLNGGTIQTAKITQGSGVGSFYFNGGTLKPTASTTAFMQGVSVAIVNPGGAIIDSMNFNVTIGETLYDGGGGLTKLGSGTLTLSGGYSYSGSTVVQAGTLSLDASQSSSASALIVSNAALSVSLNNGSSFLNAGNITFAGNSTLNLNFGTESSYLGNPAINASGYTVSNTGTNVVNITGPNLTMGEYQLIYTGGSVPTNNFTLGTLPTGVVAVLTNSGVSLDLLITASGQSLTWYGADSSGNPLTTWNINTSSNWNNGSAKYLQYAGNSYGDNVKFDDTLFNSSDANITLNTTVVPASVNFNNSSTPYSITGSGGIGGSVSVIVSGSSTVTLGTSNSFTGGIAINAGTLIVTNDNALGTNSGSVTLNGGALEIDGNTTSARPVAFPVNSSVGVGVSATAQLNGLFSGNGALTKVGNGTLALGGTNDSLGGGLTNNAGSVSVSAGATTIGSTLILNAGSFNVTGGNATIAGVNPSSIGYETTTGAVNVATGGTLTALGNIWVGGSDVTGSATGALSISGGAMYFGGPGGNGQHFADGSLAIAASQNNVSSCSGTMTVSGGTAWCTNDLIVGYAGTGTGTLNISGTGIVNIGPAAAKWLSLGKWDTSSGIINISGGNLNEMNNSGIEFSSGNGGGGGGGTNTIAQTGGTVTFFSDNGTTVGGTGELNLARSGGTTTVNTYELDGGTLIVPQVDSMSATPTRTFNFNGGTLKAAATNANFMNLGTGNAVANVRDGGAVIDSNGKDITIAQALLKSTLVGDAGIGGLTKIGSGTLTLDGTNTYAGPTVINAGTLGGTGTIAGPLTNNAMLAPGDGGNGSLTINGNITLKAASINTFVVNGSAPSNASVLVGAGVTYGGVLNIMTNGTFNAGQQFQLFSGTGATNASSFANILGSPGAGLGFTFTNGVLSVVSTSVGPSGPEHLTNSYTAGVLSLSWPAGEGWRLQIQTNSLSRGLGTNWQYITDGSISSTNIMVDSTKPTVFYRLTYP